MEVHIALDTGAEVGEGYCKRAEVHVPFLGDAPGARRVRIFALPFLQTSRGTRSKRSK